MNASWQKTKVQNLGTGLGDASIIVDKNIVDEVTDITCHLSLVKRGVSWILQKPDIMIVIGQAASAMSDLVYGARCISPWRHNSEFINFA